MCERCERSTAPHCNLRPKGVRISLRINTAYVFVGAAEICSHAKPVVEVAGDRTVEAIGIHATVKQRVLVAAEDLRFGIVILRHSCHRKQHQHKTQYEKITHSVSVVE